MIIEFIKSARTVLCILSVFESERYRDESKTLSTQRDMTAANMFVITCFEADNSIQSMSVANGTPARVLKRKRDVCNTSGYYCLVAHRFISQSQSLRSRLSSRQSHRQRRHRELLTRFSLVRLSQRIAEAKFFRIQGRTSREISTGSYLANGRLKLGTLAADSHTVRTLIVRKVLLPLSYRIR